MRANYAYPQPQAVGFKNGNERHEFLDAEQHLTMIACTLMKVVKDLKERPAALTHSVARDAPLGHLPENAVIAIEAFHLTDGSTKIRVIVPIGEHAEELSISLIQEKNGHLRPE